MTRTLETQIKAGTDDGGIPFNVYTNPSTPTATTDFDTASYDQVGILPLLASVLTGSPTVTVQLQESDTAGSGYTNVSGAVQTIDTSQDSQVMGFYRTRGLKRYVRLTSTVSGANANFGAVIVGLMPRMKEDEGAPAYSL